MYSDKNLPLVVGISGAIRAGKSTAANYLVQHFGYKCMSNVKVLSQILKALDLPRQRELLAAAGNALFSELGRDIIARARVAEIKANKHHGLRYVIDGIRYIEEVEVYKRLPSFQLIALKSTDKIRYQRTIENGDEIKDGQVTFDEFIALNHSDSEKYVPLISQIANIQLENTGDVRSLEENLKRFLTT